MADASKPRVLITGGVGFVGRNLVQYLLENDLTSAIRVADKIPPVTGWLNDTHKELFKKVDFVQVNLSGAASASRAFSHPDGPFDYVFNLAAETKYGQTFEVYRDLVYTVTVNCAQEAAKCGVKRFVDVSTAQVYNSDKGISSESSKIDPWTNIAKNKLAAEKALAEIAGLDYVVVRPAIIYGIGDKLGLTPRLIIGAVYRQLQEKMKLLWTKDLRMNTVHVRDVCRALWHLKDHGESGQVFNLADKTNTTQGTISDMVSSIFDVKHDYFGQVLSNLARLNMSSAVEESNEKHLEPWSQACAADGITNTPLSPYIDQELLYNKHTNINGSKIESTGFQYEVPNMTVDLLKEVVQDYVECRMFPPSIVPK